MPDIFEKTPQTDFTLTTHFKTAEYYARLSPYGTGPEPMIIKIDIPRGKLHEYLYRGHPQEADYVLVPPGHTQYAVKQTIPPSMVSAVYRFRDDMSGFDRLEDSEISEYVADISRRYERYLSEFSRQRSLTRRRPRAPHQLSDREVHVREHRRRMT